jgi:hypothetical protein
VEETLVLALLPCFPEYICLGGSLTLSVKAWIRQASDVLAAKTQLYNLDAKPLPGCFRAYPGCFPAHGGNVPGMSGSESEQNMARHSRHGPMALCSLLAIIICLETVAGASSVFRSKLPTAWRPQSLRGGSGEKKPVMLVVGSLNADIIVPVDRYES